MLLCACVRVIDESFIQHVHTKASYNTHAHKSFKAVEYVVYMGLCMGFVALLPRWPYDG